jgi:hypothetical protein
MYFIILMFIQIFLGKELFLTPFNWARIISRNSSHYDLLDGNYYHVINMVYL